MCFFSDRSCRAARVDASVVDGAIFIDEQWTTQPTEKNEKRSGILVRSWCSFRATAVFVSSVSSNATASAVPCSMADHGAALAAALLDTEDAKTTAVPKPRHDHGEYAGSSFILFGGLCRFSICVVVFCNSLFACCIWYVFEFLSVFPCTFQVFVGAWQFSSVSMFVFMYSCTCIFLYLYILVFVYLCIVVFVYLMNNVCNCVEDRLHCGRVGSSRQNFPASDNLGFVQKLHESRFQHIFPSKS